jgi:hypothetical protein
MTTDSGDRMRIVVYYAVWAAVCAAVAGTVVALVHTWFFSFHPTRSGTLHTLFGDLVAAAALAAGQGAVALVTGSVLAQMGRPLQMTVLLGLMLGVFDFLMYFLQMVVPKLELGWGPDVAILVGATILITLFGARGAAAASPS